MPLLKALALAGVPFLLSATQAGQEPPPPMFMAHPMVEQVLCDRGRGTAFRIGNGAMVSVAHVTVNSGCAVAGAPVVVLASSVPLDLSVLRAAHRQGMVIDCSGFHEGEWYWAVGYAWGRPVQRVIPLRASAMLTLMLGQGFAALTGLETVIPGMSGGPIINSRGQVAGTVNAHNIELGISYSRELKDTELCQPSPGA